MSDRINLQWLNGMSFETEVNGHKLYLDANEEKGGKDMGPRPKPLMMVALAGCTGMDVVSILRKMRVEYDSFNVEVEAEQTEEHPVQYKSMKVIYRFSGNDLPKAKIEKAVNLSRERYCGVSANYSKAFPLDHEIVYDEKQDT